MDTMAMAREKQSLAMDMVVLHSMPMEVIVIHIEVHRDSMDTMDMDMSMVRGLLMLSQDMGMVMLSVILIEVHKDSMDTMAGMDMDMDIMDMARDLLSQVIMVMPALLSTKAVLTTMDPTDMVSSIMARDPLMLDIMDTMDTVVLVTSKLTDPTLTMVSVWHILTKCRVRHQVDTVQ